MSMVIKRAAYVGDPFSLGGLIGGVGRVVGGAVTGFAKGGIIGGFAGAVGGLKGKTRAPSRAMPGAGDRIAIPGMDNRMGLQAPSKGLPAATGCPTGYFRKGNTCISRNPLAWAPGGTPATVPASDLPMVSGGNGVPGMSVGGYRLNKSGYWLANNSQDKGQGATWVPAGTQWVKVRRRNPGNIKATMRGLARVKSTKALASRLAHVSIRKKC